MTDYTKNVTYSSKTSADTILGSEFDVEFSEIQTVSATKANKNVSAKVGNVAAMNSDGDVIDSGHPLAGDFVYVDGEVLATNAVGLLIDTPMEITSTTLLNGKASIAIVFVERVNQDAEPAAGRYRTGFWTELPNTDSTYLIFHGDVLTSTRDVAGTETLAKEGLLLRAEVTSLGEIGITVITSKESAGSTVGGDFKVTLLGYYT